MLRSWTQDQFGSGTTERIESFVTTAAPTTPINATEASAGESATRTPTLSLSLGALGFALWALGWFLLIADRSSHAAWILQVVGPMLVAVGIIAYIDHLARRIGIAAVVLGAVGAITCAIATLPYAINPDKLSSASGLRFGYGAYGVGLLLGFLSVAIALSRKESALEHAGTVCPAGCRCNDVVHASFVSLTTAALGLLLWGIGFLQLMVSPGGSRMGWILATIGTALVATGITAHIDHLGARFGRLAIATGIASAFIWSLGYLMNALNPTAGFHSTWYTVLFYCYAVGHLLTAVSLVLVIGRGRRSAATA